MDVSQPKGYSFQARCTLCFLATSAQILKVAARFVENEKKPKALNSRPLSALAF